MQPAVFSRRAAEPRGVCCAQACDASELALRARPQSSRPPELRRNPMRANAPISVKNKGRWPASPSRWILSCWSSQPWGRSEPSGSGNTAGGRSGVAAAGVLASAAPRAVSVCAARAALRDVNECCSVSAEARSSSSTKSHAMSRGERRRMAHPASARARSGAAERVSARVVLAALRARAQTPTPNALSATAQPHEHARTASLAERSALPRVARLAVYHLPPRDPLRAACISSSCSMDAGTQARSPSRR